MELSLQQKADQPADTVHRAFEPADPPDRSTLKRVAAKTIPILERLARDYRATTYGGVDDD